MKRAYIIIQSHKKRNYETLGITLLRQKTSGAIIYQIQSHIYVLIGLWSLCRME